MFSSFSRRQFLNLISFVGIGTVVAGSVPFLGNLFVSKAEAQEISEEVYKGRKYRIVTNQTQDPTGNIDNTFDTSKQLFLDDKQIRIIRNKKTDKYMTPVLFGEFNSPHEIARRLIDQGIKFPIGEVKLDPNVD
ncbi:hypothetical protein PI95_012715 [Hassallia byssoidea VB512170]|uniref:Uncharacterized protein n=1 Tax=Hassallia byssoidea VB512170 TaxID=1304833 RepID=A0A846H9N4_9CYAN|nr:hypothetical protein [Hassalia byssoidea]NEU73404.1 hypothetical protein [Hassalia byssoidea VB512170]